MSKNDVIASARDGFKARFGRAPDAVAYAPGRVNLMGEHTDYNGGLVLPMPLALGTAAALGEGGLAGCLEAASDAFEDIDTRRFDEQAKGAWSDYVLGSLMEVLGAAPSSGMQAMIATDLPVGSGLSSSAAIEISTMRAACQMLGLDISPVDMAIKARSVENNFVGLPSGIMDQFSVSVGESGRAVFLDTRKLEHAPVPLPQGYKFVIVHSGVGHKLTDDGYAQRVEECRLACARLGVGMLSDLDVSDMDRINRLEAPLDGRSRHIVTENARVTSAVKALEAGDVARFGELMVESHNSQRDDYAVSVPQVDALIDGALDAGATGARLTGGGFGGSIVALVATDQVETWCDTITSRFLDTRILAIT